MSTDRSVCEPEREAPEKFQWYLIESSSAGPSRLADRPLELGPFASESECRAVLDSARRIVRFRNSVLEIRKRSERGDQRFRVEYTVRLCRPGNDAMVQLPRTMDISTSGVRLGGLTARLNPGEIFTIHWEERKAPFQVVWVGSGSAADQAGLKCLAPEVNIWKLESLQLTPEQRLPREIDRARTVQNRLFPQQKPWLQTLDYSGHCIQARTVGGDYYDFLPFAPGDVGLVVADVSGKGVAGALLMANLHGSLQAQWASGSRDPLRLLASVNRHLHKHTESQRYVTAFLGCYRDQGRVLRYVNCGHNPPLVLRHHGAVERLEPTATVLGVFPDWEGAVGETTIAPGDILSIYTDGITETRGLHDEEFGEARLLRTIRMNRHLEAACLLQKVEKVVEEFRFGDCHDDLTMIIARGR
ncbi:MAG: PP2C family protein-serine/threonine phosphatase [Terriglobales bacterium]